MYKGNISYHKMPDIPENCKLVNKQLKDYNFAEIKTELDYLYYVMKAISLLNIEWFELKGNDYIQTSRFSYNIE